MMLLNDVESQVALIDEDSETTNDGETTQDTEIVG